MHQCGGGGSTAIVVVALRLCQLRCRGDGSAVWRSWGRDGDGVVVVVWLLLCQISEGGSCKIELGGGDVVVEEHQICPHLSWVLLCM
jgi:hypothetical protein